ncbi:copper resistance D family protein [Mycolicibacterium pulveris]|uniref:copper resistance D family protein n=1 Tax=Mycolicibacterium pulveris TaxID=36813 RepID=UPI001F30F0E9|nr:CopD family protein [Mycolicibacterium pulveris]
MTRCRAVAGGALVVAAAAALAWALAYPQASLTETLVRAVSDCAAVVALGLAAVPMLDGDRYRAELVSRAAPPLAASAGVWLLSELTRLVVAAAQTAGIRVLRLDMGTVADFVVATTAGRAGLVALAAAAVVCVAALAAPRAISTVVMLTGVAAIGVVARPLTGHFSDSALGGFAVAVHMLAAALWCGVLAALLLTVEHRGQWARLLPRFSTLSLWCVVALLAGGVLGAAVRLDSAADLYATGYGRVLSAKIAMTAALVVLGWRNRTMWLPAARAHRATAVVSRSRSVVELSMMAVALALAAGLAVTG